MDTETMKGKFTRIESRYSKARRLPRLGKIRLGFKVEALGKGQFPRETDYFVCPPEVQEVYGEKPTELDVILPSDDAEVVFPQKLVMYGSGSGLKCHGNGKIAERYNEQTKAWEPRSCPCEFLKTHTNPRGACDEQSNLMVILPKVSMGGCYQIKTGSVVSTENINSALDMTRAVAGRIAMLPMKLRRVAQQMNHDGKPRTHYVLNLILNATYQQIADLRNSPSSLLIPAQYQIEGPVDENPELDPPDVQEVDAEKIAEMGEQELDDLREKLKAKQQEASAMPTAAPSSAPVPSGAAPAQNGSHKSASGDGIPDEKWADIKAYLESDSDLSRIRDSVLLGMKSGGMDKLGNKNGGRAEFLKRAKIVAGKAGLTWEVC